MTDNTDDDTLIDKADALMRRRGSNLPPDLTEALALTESDTSTSAHEASIDQPDDTHTSVEQSDIASPDPALSASIVEQDIPTLTDIVQTGMHIPADSATSSESLKGLDTWLEETLPQIIATALDNLKDPLTQELRHRIRAEFFPEKTTNPQTENPSS